MENNINNNINNDNNNNIDNINNRGPKNRNERKFNTNDNSDASPTYLRSSQQSRSGHSEI